MNRSTDPDGRSGPVTIGIVTALADEYAAVRALVANLERVVIPNDPNHYYTATLPSVQSGRPHRLAITVLPQDGNKTASAVCADLIRSFPSIHCVIMCGVAGGIPAPHDPRRHVRLGDIVVAEYGVVDYDHVQTVNGTDEIRRHLRGLSAQLLLGVRELKAQAVTGDHPWERWLPEAGSPFARPPDRTDVLYRRGEVVAHPARDRSGHRAGLPKVHYSAIASADRLLRDEKLRDTLAARYQVSAVEMEASGIATSSDLHARHWFVVRGVVDYCEHQGKNDTWHRYGSAVAAAYVRALLEQVPTFATGGSPAAAFARRPAGAEDQPAPATRVPAELIGRLLRIPEFNRAHNRDTLVALLPSRIRHRIERRGAVRADIVEILLACLDDKRGIEELVEAVRTMAGDDTAEVVAEATASLADSTDGP